MADQIEEKIKISIDSAEAAKSIGDLRKALNGLSDVLSSGQLQGDGLKQLGSQLDNIDKKATKGSKGVEEFGKSVGELGGNVKKLGGEIPGVESAMKALDVVFAASGIGLLVIAVGLLIAAFAKTEVVGDAVTRVFNEISAVVGVIIERLGHVARAVIKVFSGDWPGAVDEAKQATDNLSQSLKEAVKGADKATDAAIALENAHAKNTIRLAKLNKELAKQKTLMRVIGQDQKKAAKEAIRLTNEVTSIKVEEAQQQLEIFNLEHKGRTELTRSEIQQQADLTAAVIDAQTEGIEANKRAEVELSKIDQAERVAQEKKNKEYIESSATRQQAELDLEKDSLQKRLDQQELNFEKEERELTDAGETKENIQKKFDQERADITKKFNDDIQAQKDAADKKAQETIRQNHQIDFDLMKSFKVKQKDIDDAFNKAQLENAQITYKEFAQLYKDDLEAKKASEKAKTEETDKAAKERKEIEKGVMEALNGLSELMSQMDSQRTGQTLAQRNAAAKKEFNTKKGLGIVNAAISTAEGIAAAVAQSPTTGGLPGSAIAAAVGAIQIATIAAKKFTPESGSTSTTAPTAPSVPSSPGGSTNPQMQPQTFFGLGNNPGGQGIPPQKVYVTEGDITSTQNKVSVIQGRSLIH